MSIVLIGAGIWLATSIIIGLIVGRLLRKISRHYPPTPPRRETP